MIKDFIKVSLTEFMNFINKSGFAKKTVVATAKKKRDDSYEFYKDYWLKFREKIKEIHKNNLYHQNLKELINEIPEDKQYNYNKAIDGYIKFWKKQKIEWVNPPKKSWVQGDLSVELNPELGLVIDNKIYVIKLHLSSTEDIDKRHADLILNLMEIELRNEVKEDTIIFGVLDVKRGKLFLNQNKDISAGILLKAEAKSFESIWKDL